MRINVNLQSSIALFAAILAFLSYPAAAQNVSDITDLILVTGQSNVRGSQTDYDPVLDAAHPRVFAFTTNKESNAYSSGGVWQKADLHQAWDVDGWHPGNGSSTDNSRQPYNHFAFHLAKTVAESDPNKVVGIVIAAAPGEGIQHWDVGGDFGGTKYTDGVTFAEVVEGQALAALNAQGVKASFDAVIWHQGETDWQKEGTSDPDVLTHYLNDDSYDPALDTNYYPNKLNKLIARYRNVSWFDTGKPFICGETKQALVNERLMALNDDGDAYTGCVAASDLSTREGSATNLGTHFDAEGLRTLGQRYGQKYLEMTGTIPKINAVKVMAVGDSITQGINGSDSYRPEFAELLDLSGCDFEMVGSKGTDPHKHEGYSGHSAEHMIVGLNNNPGIEVMMSQHTPDVVLLHIGSNDMRRAQTVVSTITEINNILDIIKNKNTDATILVANVIPWWGTSSQNTNVTPDVKSLGDAIEILISERGDPNIVLVDVREGFTRSMMQTDLIHPVTAGESFIADAFFDAYGLFYSCAQSPDLTAPRTFITVPAENENIEGATTYAGYATDTGGSGFNRIRIAVRDTNTQLWYSFPDDNNPNSGTFGPIGNNGIVNASLSNTSDSYTDWSIDISLPTGNYQFFALAVDENGNDAYTGKELAVWPVNTMFAVDSHNALDNAPPETNIIVPSASQSIEGATQFHGAATDTGGSGFDQVRVAILDRSTSQWYDFETNSFGSWSYSTANLSSTTSSYTDWSISTNLQPGNYTLVAHTYDNAGNRTTNPDGSNKWASSQFSVASTDAIPPETLIDSPVQGESLSVVSTISGYATDSGGAGFDLVRVAILNLNTRQWLNFDNNTFGVWSFTAANLANTTGSYTDWSVDTTLQPGNYIVVALTYDNAGNKTTNPDGSNKWTSAHFSVAATDTMPPETLIDSPVQGGSPSVNPTISGYATDSGGAGIDLVRVAILNLNTLQWLNFDNNTFGGWSFTTANLSNTTVSYTDWYVDTNLQPGSYIVVAHAYDNAGNRTTNPDGSNKWTSAQFLVR